MLEWPRRFKSHEYVWPWFPRCEVNLCLPRSLQCRRKRECPPGSLRRWKCNSLKNPPSWAVFLTEHDLWKRGVPEHLCISLTWSVVQLYRVAQPHRIRLCSQEHQYMQVAQSRFINHSNEEARCEFSLIRFTKQSEWLDVYETNLAGKVGEEQHLAM